MRQHPGTWPTPTCIGVDMVTVVPAMRGEKSRTLATAVVAVRSLVQTARAAKSPAVAESEVLAQLHQAEPLVDIDGFPFDGHRDELHDLLHDLVAFEDGPRLTLSQT